MSIDLARAVVVTVPGIAGVQRKAVALLLDEVARRTQIRWLLAHDWPDVSVPVIVLVDGADLERFAGYLDAPVEPDVTRPAEGYRIATVQAHGQPVIVVAGNDARGLLYGTGHLLRTLEMTRRSISLAEPLDIVTAPAYPLRGHQLGYRPKTNSYDGWDLALWEQYIRDLVVFGTNAIELIPPRSDDDADSPHFPLPPLEMMAGMSQMCDDYDLDVWIWYPAMDEDYSNPATVDFAVQEWAEVFSHLPRVDAIFVPGGDPGRTRPRDLMALLEKQAVSLRQIHPAAQVWVSAQSFSSEWLAEFVALLEQEPVWLNGIVYGPQTRVSLPVFRRMIPARYPIRHYPDITHTRQCQYPVSNWDYAFAFSEGREPINPRPLAYAHIFRLLQPYTIGFITYSEGCNDDVNKFVWSALGWNPGAEVLQILRDYSRYFIGPAYTTRFAQGLLALERNWDGPALTNEAIYTTLDQFRALERAASPQLRLNWRFQQALYRAYYDAYTRSRLLFERELEDRAQAKLRLAGQTGSLVALQQAEALCLLADSERTSPDWRARIFELAEALFQSIRMQLSVERYQAIAVSRGANLDTIDYPLNNRLWLRQEIASIRQCVPEEERLERIEALVARTNPGPGGYYDDLGNLTQQPHLVRGAGFEHDPACYAASLIGYANPLGARGRSVIPAVPGDLPVYPLAWWYYAESLYDMPLKMQYHDLDPSAHYRVRVAYAGDQRSALIRLVAHVAEQLIEIHPYLPKEYRPLEFEIPAAAIQNGELELAWYRQPGRGGNGRGCQVAEVWLLYTAEAE